MTGETDEAHRRLDQWLWYARFFKSRSAATRFCGEGRLRVNSRIVAKAHHHLREGDVLTFMSNDHVRVIRVVGLGTRRGPAPEAQGLYEDLSPPASPRSAAESPPMRREPGSGRPTKAERRAIDRLRDRD